MVPITHSRGSFTSMLSLISNNPYRLMGIYSNAPLKDLVANKNRLAAFARVGKTLTFPTDLTNLIGEVPNRSSESISEAMAELDLPEDRICHALFWFIKVTPIDTVALSNLQTNNIAKARSILLKKENFSSLLNLGVLALFEGDVPEGVDKITSLIHTDEYREALIDAVCGQQFQISEEDLAKAFIDTLCQEISLDEVREAFDSYGSSVEDDDYIHEKQVALPTCHIKSEISIAKNCNPENAEVQYQAGIRLLRNTHNDVKKLTNLLDADDVDYQLIINPLSETILECSIAYFNHTNDKNDYEKALFLANYALSIATEDELKTRCRKYIETFNSKKEAAKYQEESNQINTASDAYLTDPPSLSKASSFLLATKPALAQLKTKAGASSPYYLNRSSFVANRTVDIVVRVLNSRQEHSSYEDIKDGSLKKTFESALEILSSVSTLDMSDKVYEYFSTNKKIISKSYAYIAALTERARPSPLQELLGFLIRNWWIIVPLIIFFANL